MFSHVSMFYLYFYQPSQFTINSSPVFVVVLTVDLGKLFYFSYFGFQDMWKGYLFFLRMSGKEMGVVQFSLFACSMTLFIYYYFLIEIKPCDLLSWKAVTVGIFLYLLWKNKAKFQLHIKRCKIIQFILLDAFILD